MTATARRLRESVDPVPPPADGTHRAICRQIKMVSNSLTRRVDTHMQPLELTGMQWEPLLLVWLKRADTVAALARVSQVGVPSMTRMLDRLEAKGLVARVRSATDRRVVTLKLTKAGHEVVDHIPFVLAEVNNLALKQFSATEYAQFIDFLKRMNATLSEEENPE